MSGSLLLMRLEPINRREGSCKGPQLVERELDAVEVRDQLLRHPVAGAGLRPQETEHQVPDLAATIRGDSKVPAAAQFQWPRTVGPFCRNGRIVGQRCRSGILLRAPPGSACGDGRGSAGGMLMG